MDVEPGQVVDLDENPDGNFFELADGAATDDDTDVEPADEAPSDDAVVSEPKGND
jgi:hypothetical protein